jgi:hypothetical protein
MEKINFSKLLNDIEISHETLMKLAFETGLINRKRIISAYDLFYSLCLESINGTVSYNDIAAHIEAENGVSVSRQAVWKKVTEPCFDFFQRVLELVILSKIDKTQVDAIRKPCQFKRILVQDSTIIKLPVKLFKDFSGVANQCSKVCNARIQGVYDIVNECFITFSIDPYSKNDLEAAPDLELKQGDLTLRDRGYLIYDEIQRHIDIGANCIYRYKHGMTLIDPLSELPIDILKELTKNKFIDMQVKLNNKDKTLVRLTASPVDEKIANTRRMKAKQEKKLHLPGNICNYYHGQSLLQQSPKNRQNIKQYSRYIA